MEMPAAEDNPGVLRKRMISLRWLTLGLILSPLLILIVILLRADSLSSWLAGRVAENIVPLDTPEMPPTAFTPTASSLEFAAISGRGEGLDCSIEPIIERRAFPTEAGNETVNLFYRQACVAHDYCYRHGAATYGYSQADCDAMLARAALRICEFPNKTNRSEQSDDCLARARKVYSGLVFGGADSFRPLMPDLRKPSGSAPVYGAWVRAIDARFAGSGLASTQEKALAAERSNVERGDYGKLSSDGLSRLLNAWLDVASIVGEYDPYPLGTAGYATPRLARIDKGGAALVYFLHRPGGSLLSVYRWKSVNPGGPLRACVQETCGVAATPSPLPAQYGALPNPPWVGNTGPGPEKLVWWQRLNTGKESTSGNLVSATYSPDGVTDKGTKRAGPWIIRTAPNIEPDAATVFPVRGTTGSFGIAAVTDQLFHNPRLNLLIWSGQQVQASPWHLQQGIATISLKAGNPAQGVSQKRLPPLLPSPLFAVKASAVTTDITLFRRGERPDDYRNELSAWTFHMSTPTAPLNASGKPIKPITSPDLLVADQIFKVPEQAEPSIPLVGRDGQLRLITLQCEPGTADTLFGKLAVDLNWIEPPRCSPLSARTRITLYRASPAEPIAPVAVEGRYLPRAILIENPARSKNAPRYLLVLVRYGLKRDGNRVELVAYDRILGIGDDYIGVNAERYLGVISPVGENSAKEALLRVGTLLPIVGDVDGDGAPDLVIADTKKGSNSLAFPKLVPADGLVWTKRSVR